MKKLLVVGAVVVGAVLAAKRLAPDQDSADRRPLATMRQRLLARMLAKMPPDSPPKLVMSILPRLREQNDEIIALLREQNELLRRGRLRPTTREGGGPS